MQPLVGQHADIAVIDRVDGVEVSGIAKGLGFGDGDFYWAVIVGAVIIGRDSVEFSVLADGADGVNGKSDLLALAGVPIRSWTGFGMVVGCLYNGGADTYRNLAFVSSRL